MTRDTDAEGRLLLADVLCYSHSFNPSAVIDLATLTGAIDVALGSGAAAVFTNSPPLWDKLHMATFFYPEYKSIALSPQALYLPALNVAHKDIGDM